MPSFANKAEEARRQIARVRSFGNEIGRSPRIGPVPARNEVRLIVVVLVDQAEEVIADDRD